jgi:excisionase family DNA binding protein
MSSTTAGLRGQGAQGSRKRSGRPPSTALRLVSLAAGAAFADVSVRTLRRYIAQGRLTGYRVGPRLVKVDLHELEQLARPIPAAPAGSPGVGLPRVLAAGTN